jgi:hypothetical protein
MVALCFFKLLALQRGNETMSEHLLTNPDFWEATRDAWMTLAMFWLVWRSFR